MEETLIKMICDDCHPYSFTHVRWMEETVINVITVIPVIPVITRRFMFPGLFSFN